MEDQHSTPELFLFLASTVHDMKNSISVVSGTLESLLAAEQAKSTDEVTADPAYLQMAQMLYQTKRLNDNLIQLLALYKQVGKPGYPFDVQPQLVGQLVDAGGGPGKNPARLQGHRDGDGLSARADLDARRRPGDRRAGPRHQQRHPLHERHDTPVGGEEGGMLELRVEDNGDGYTQALLDAGEAAMDGQSSGVNFSTNSTGLGLYFSSEVAKMHKHRGRSGAIALSNGGLLGGGCFILRLP